LSTALHPATPFFHPVLQRLNSRLYSNFRTARAWIAAACGCAGLMSVANSSGTMTEGTSRIADFGSANHWNPVDPLGPGKFAYRGGLGDFNHFRQV